MQGSKHESVLITFEQRTEGIAIDCADLRPITRYKVPDHIRNKSGTAEDSIAFVSFFRGKGVFL